MSARRGGGAEEGDSKQAGDGWEETAQTGERPAAGLLRSWIRLASASRWRRPASGGRLFLPVGGARRIGGSRAYPKRISAGAGPSGVPCRPISSVDMGHDLNGCGGPWRCTEVMMPVAASPPRRCGNHRRPSLSEFC